MSEGAWCCGFYPAKSLNGASSRTKSWLFEGPSTFSTDVTVQGAAAEVWTVDLQITKKRWLFHKTARDHQFTSNLGGDLMLHLSHTSPLQRERRVESSERRGRRGGSAGREWSCIDGRGDGSLKAKMLQVRRMKRRLLRCRSCVDHLQCCVFRSCRKSTDVTRRVPPLRFEP